MTLQQIAHAVMVRVDPLGTALDVLPVANGSRTVRARPPRRDAGLDQGDVVTVEHQLSGRGEAGHPGPDDDDSHDGRAQPPASVEAIFEDESPERFRTEYTNASAMTVTPNNTTAAAPTKGLVVLLAVPMT